MLQISLTTLTISHDLLVTLIGLCVGSFLNVIIIRYPQMLQFEWHDQSSTFLNLPTLPAAKFNLLLPRSHCPHCQTTLRWYDTIPLISYLKLAGRCATCKQTISKHYPLIELLTAITTFIIFYHFGDSWQMVCACLFSWYLITLAMIDFKTQLLPDLLTLSLLWLGLLISVPGLFITAQSAIVAAATGYSLLWGISYLFLYVRKKPGMGHGDFKLAAALGAWMGIMPLLYALTIAAILTLSITILLLLCRKIQYNQPLPFGPALAIASWGICCYSLW